jgi:hypothetical protein
MLRSTAKAWAIALAVLGVIVIVIALVYVGVRASSLPSWMPGYRHPVLTKRGRTVAFGQLKRQAFVLLLVGAAALGVGWWLAYRYEAPDSPRL